MTSGNLGTVTVMAQARYAKRCEGLPRASLILTADKGELHMSGINLTYVEAIGLLRDGIKLLEANSQDPNLEID
jgi:hypothetical protein